MSLLTRLKTARGGGEKLGEDTAQALARWSALPRVRRSRPHFETRYVVVNTEATGLDLDRDRLLAVAALGVDGGFIRPADAYYAQLEPAAGEALVGLLGVTGKSPLVVFNASFNRNVLERALQEHLGLATDLLWLDLYFLLPSLFPEKLERPSRLGDWMAAFGIETFQRHHALGDAWAIAQLFLAAQARAQSLAVSTPRALAEHEQAFRRKLKI